MARQRRADVLKPVALRGGYGGRDDGDGGGENGDGADGR